MKNFQIQNLTQGFQNIIACKKFSGETAYKLSRNIAINNNLAKELHEALKLIYLTQEESDELEAKVLEGDNEASAKKEEILGRINDILNLEVNQKYHLIRPEELFCIDEIDPQTIMLLEPILKLEQDSKIIPLIPVE